MSIMSPLTTQPRWAVWGAIWTRVRILTVTIPTDYQPVVSRWVGVWHIAWTNSPERLFSTAGNVMTKKRSRLTCDNMEELVYLEVWPQVRKWEAVKKMRLE